ncbi:DUF6415 family natural product biosynthesis protein [Streptomyces nodosus]|uniref:DUF6415 family natural product biosynthesis protein n=1 Tax=Streptomyces nodosus TaxID=40318 RepID=UPI00382E14E7
MALVLGEDSPLPDTAADVEDLALRLRGHVSQLGALTPSQEPALLRAQQLCSGGLPDGYMPSRVHLVRLAEATQDLIAAVQAHDVAPAKSVQRRRWWKPPINVLRGAVFALACVVLAASVPPDMTAAGAVLIALILGPMAWLALRGDRVSGRIAPRDVDPPPRQNRLPPIR